jgi:hypothetical protein
MEEYSEYADELLNVYVIKFYMPEYGSQSPPFIVPITQGMTLRDALIIARDRYLNWLQHDRAKWGKYHPSHVKMWEDGRITHSERFARMTRNEIAMAEARAKQKLWKKARR